MQDKNGSFSWCFYQYFLLGNFATCVRVHSMEGKSMFQFYWNEDTAKATSKWCLVLVLRVCEFGDLNMLICVQKF